ncbi:hypothetical protein NLX83_23380 [Allokutzneria sp. A3M-2-11 16]|uniref:hypothetical protein n=1 Tax=Allokutzneria sp. A3M-2-11 16 TaxID=2962043 RepID=UPI0020B728A3|nr:hypothetical protein [Allokutzneria sp. A3M-2-11 16]MCP3802215.1 hypothetical protein [Allokutzneria sp. A3M-2-11 16]
MTHKLAVLSITVGMAVAFPSPAQSATTIWVGASTGSQAAGWSTAQNAIGDDKLSYRRSFDPTLRSPDKASWRVAGSRHWYSAKPPENDIQGYIDGKYDGQLRALAKDLPPGTIFTVYHEPEDDMSGATFNLLMRKTIDVVKAANPGVLVWYSAMAYQWETNSKGNVGSPAGWIDAARAADGVSLDVYASPGDGPLRIRDDKGFKRWWDLIKVPSGKPWGISERGIAAAHGEQRRIAVLKDDWAFVKERGAHHFLYWQNNNDGKWMLTGSEEKAAFRAIAAQGRQN